MREDREKIEEAFRELERITNGQATTMPLTVQIATALLSLRRQMQMLRRDNEMLLAGIRALLRENVDAKADLHDFLHPDNQPERPRDP